MSTKLPDNLTNQRAVQRYFTRSVNALKKKYDYVDLTPSSFNKLRPSLLKLIYDFGTEVHKSKATKRFGRMAALKARNADSKVDEDNVFAVIMEKYIRGQFDEKHLSSGQRSRYLRALAYAHKHKVTTNWLGAFLKESGGYEKAAIKYSAGKRERWVTPQATFE